MSLLAGNGFDTDLDVAWKEYIKDYYLPSGVESGKAGASGYICALDQVIDTFVPFVEVSPYNWVAKKVAPSFSYTTANGEIIDDYRSSRQFGNLAGTALSFALTANFINKMSGSTQSISILDDAFGVAVLKIKGLGGALETESSIMKVLGPLYDLARLPKIIKHLEEIKEDMLYFRKTLSEKEKK